MNRRTLLGSLAGVLLLGAAACGTASGASPGPEAPPEGDAPISGVCEPDAPDCVDTVPVPVDQDGDMIDDWDSFPSDDAREAARGVLGRHETDLDQAVRVARRGAETMMLTQDYVLGRLTVELDDDGNGYRVTSVTVELPDGPETYDLEPS